MSGVLAPIPSKSLAASWLQYVLVNPYQNQVTVTRVTRMVSTGRPPYLEATAAQRNFAMLMVREVLVKKYATFAT